MDAWHLLIFKESDRASCGEGTFHKEGQLVGTIEGDFTLLLMLWFCPHFLCPLPLNCPLPPPPPLHMSLRCAGTLDKEPERHDLVPVEPLFCWATWSKLPNLQA